MHIFELNVKAILERIQCFGPKSIHSVLFVTMGLSEFYNKLQCFTIAKISSLKKQFRYFFFKLPRKSELYSVQGTNCSLFASRLYLAYSQLLGSKFPSIKSDVWLTVHRNSVWIRRTN